jgi:hypothetical protein
MSFVLAQGSKIAKQQQLTQGGKISSAHSALKDSHPILTDSSVLIA